MRKYWLVEEIENNCFVTRVGVYNEIQPEPSSCHNTVTKATKLIFKLTQAIGSLQLVASIMDYALGT